MPPTLAWISLSLSKEVGSLQSLPNMCLLRAVAIGPFVHCVYTIQPHPQSVVRAVLEMGGGKLDL